MRMRRAEVPAGGVVLGVLLLAVGCGGEGPTDSEATLGSAESADLAATVAEQAMGVLVDRTDDAGPAVPTDESGPLSGSILFSRAHACSQGGKATIAGRLQRNFVPEGQELTVDFSMTIVHEACGVRSGDRTLSLTGSPGLDVQAAYREVEGRLAGPQRATVEGRVQWSASGGQEGSCGISLETELDPAEGTFSIGGEACGHAVDRSLDR